MFDPSISVSFVKDGTEWTLENWHGKVEGVLGIDNVQSLSVGGDLDTMSSNCRFGMVTMMRMHENLQADGMLGLWDFSTQPCKPFIYQLKGERKSNNSKQGNTVLLYSSENKFAPKF
ncbi:unnamed protein product [Cylicostephanus goldi]|uniref:Peptidase A1 domain-containing protein n=1 Tax=Cylicostephanus goldi TaxID=71465 RepID=A0A3P6U6X1_CYLGO|nr:unnamed protein product [Cylicostephanus goldi]